MDDLKETIARNLVKLRQDAGYTQVQLADMLNYSDKAVSKWERAEAIPDLHVLIRIGEIYGVTLDQLVSPQKDKPIQPKRNVFRKRVLICLLCVGLCFFVAAVLFTLLHIFSSSAPYAYCVFAIAFFASAIVFTVLSAVWWGSRLVTAIAASLIAWSLVVMLHVIFDMCGLEGIVDKIYLFYITAGVFQVLVVIWYIFRRVR